MSQVIRISESLYKRLETHVRGFDTPSGVIERVLDFYEEHYPKIADPNDSLVSSVPKTNMSAPIQARFQRKPYSAVASGSFRRDIENDIYTITSPEGISKAFKLPDVNDKSAIREITHQVETFVKEQGGTIGQIKSARKKLTEFGYHITKN